MTAEAELANDVAAEDAEGQLADDTQPETALANDVAAEDAELEGQPADDAQAEPSAQEPQSTLFAAFESDVARVGKPAPVAHLVDRIQVEPPHPTMVAGLGLDREQLCALSLRLRLTSQSYETPTTNPGPSCGRISTNSRNVSR